MKAVYAGGFKWLYRCMKTLKDLGEHNAIAALTANLKAAGDDCAVLPFAGAPYDLVLTSDPLIAGIHFTAAAPPEQIGWKAAARVFSDFAAMGADPQYLLINAVAPPEQNFETLKKIYSGVHDVCAQFSVELAGGDLAQGPALELHVFGAGCVPKDKAVFRSGARAGDAIYVTGALGDSLNTGKHLTFTPRVKEGKWLRQSGYARAMIDISDGLATDIRHILKASGSGADLIPAQIPLNGTLEQALYDGEDFELLFTVRGDEADRFDFDCLHELEHKFHRIGTVTAAPEILTLAGEPLERKAFEHFKN
ncbi:MAG: thiamine-phosphate kinase [Kiritimatiellales bacterium]